MTDKPWKIHHGDLSQGFHLPEAEDQYEGVLLFCWWGHTPLGQVRKTRAEWAAYRAAFRQSAPADLARAVGYYYLAAVLAKPGLPPADTAVSLAHLFGSHRAAAGSSHTSVVVCTRDRPDQLRRCLRSLLNLARTPARILVVDNAPQTPGTRLVVGEFADVCYLAEPTPGLSVARNAGLNGCQTELVAFTDDDVVVHEQWLNRIEEAFSDPAVMIVTGLVIPHSLDTQAECAFEFDWGFNRGFVPRLFDQAYFEAGKETELAVWDIGAGANMAVRTTVLRQTGNFDERLGAGASGCSEDSELWYRVLAAGHACYYEPRAVVFHHHRSDMRRFRQQIEAYMRGHVVALLIQRQQHGHKANLRRLLVRLPLLSLHRMASRRFWMQLLAGENTFLPEWKGILSGIAYYFRHAGRKNKHDFRPHTPVEAGGATQTRTHA